MQNHVFNDLTFTGKVSIEIGKFPGHFADAANRKTDGSAAQQAPARTPGRPIAIQEQAQGQERHQEPSWHQERRQAQVYQERRQAQVRRPAQAHPSWQSAFASLCPCRLAGKLLSWDHLLHM